MKSAYQEIIESEVQGIPCLIGVSTYNVVNPWKGSARTAPSDLDYYGYTDIEYDLLKFNHTPFTWLENKLTKEDHWNIEETIDNYFKDMEEYTGPDNFKDLE